MMNRFAYIGWGGALCLAALVCPDPALALQVHGGPEGLYVHQMAHLHYFFALGYFFWDLRRVAFTNRGWRYLQWFCLLTACWNLLAFAGHAAGTLIDSTSLLQTEQYLDGRLLGPMTFTKYLYFLTRLDHLVYVPALFCLYLALRSFYRSVERSTAQEEE